MSEYVLTETSHGDIDGCHRCNSEVPTQAFDTHHPDPPGKVRLCRFCAETELGAILHYPREHPEIQALTRGLCQAFNLLYDHDDRR